jgi:Mg2+ and Co2+ transporter CorA
MNLINSGQGFKQCQYALQNSASDKQGPINVFRDDFIQALSYMEEYQQRIDRLTSIVTAAISIKASRRSQGDNRNVARLTWLATFSSRSAL